MYPKNAASPEPIAIGAVVQISDGEVQTSGVTVRIKPVGVAEGDGGGTVAYSTDGIVLYTPTQAETNYTSFILIAKKTGCIPVAITIVTTASSVPGRTMPADGSITAAVLADNSIDTATFAAGTTIPRVTLCDTTTVNTDMRGTDNAATQISVNVIDDLLDTEVDLIIKLLRADHYIDTSVNPWALVYMEEGTGGIGVGTELFRKRLYSTSGVALTSTDTVVGQSKE